jgi:hypothetical protein
MADQHNSNIPALTNQVAEDIPDIKENLEFHKDAFEKIFETWSASDNSSAQFDSTTVFSDGTYTYTIPTNGVAGNAKFMIGNSSTIIWMYLNAAPPGWKALTTGGDTVLGVSGGTGDYNVNGGNADSTATWTQDTHQHKWYNWTAAGTTGQSFAETTGSAQNLANVASTGEARHIVLSSTNSKSINADQWTTLVAPANTWRPSASPAEEVVP